MSVLPSQLCFVCIPDGVSILTLGQIQVDERHLIGREQRKLGTSYRTSHGLQGVVHLHPKGNVLFQYVT